MPPVRSTHVIDPSLDGPAGAGVAAATVVAGSGWCAEVFATAAIVARPADALRMVTAEGAEVLLVTDDGVRYSSPGLHPFLVAPRAA